MRNAKKRQKHLWTFAVVCGVVVVASFLNNTSDGAPAREEEEPVVQIVTSEPSPTSTPSPTSPDPPEMEEAPAPSPINGNRPESTAERRLASRARDFLGAFYTVPPDATERSMRAAVAATGPASPDFMERVYFGVEETQQLRNRERWDKQLTIRAAVKQGDLLVRKTGEDVYTVEALVSMVILDRDGEEESTEEKPAVTVWTLDSGEWILLGFGDHFNETGGE